MHPLDPYRRRPAWGTMGVTSDEARWMVVGHRIKVRSDEGEVTVDGRDVAGWLGLAVPPDPDDDSWRQRAVAYVAEHPRAHGTAGLPASQRLALLRRLATGPASRRELLAAMRTAGWVGGDDLENRLRDLRAGDRRAGAAQQGLTLEQSDGRVRLVEPLPLLGDADRRALAFAKTMIGRLDGPLAQAAGAALEGLLPGLPGDTSARVPGAWGARAADYERFEAARAERRGVHVRYYSANSERENTYMLVPVEYVTLGSAVKAICVPVDADGARAGEAHQFAMDRLVAVDELPEQPPTRKRDLEVPRTALVLEMTDGLYQVARQRNLFGLGEAPAVQSDEDDSWRVSGTFPTALAWDVMEQLCAWAGNVLVHEPWWMVNAVLRRLRAGTRVMEEGGAFELVKPEPNRVFSSHEEAVRTDAPLPEQTGPRRLKPRQI
jgi:hypothetical protein